jgi:hypothetical protein
LEREWNDILLLCSLIASNLHDGYFLTKEYMCDKITKIEVGGAYNMYGGGEGYMKDNVYQYFESHTTHSL